MRMFFCKARWKVRCEVKLGVSGARWGEEAVALWCAREVMGSVASLGGCRKKVAELLHED